MSGAAPSSAFPDPSMPVLQKQIEKLREELELLVKSSRKMLDDLEAERARILATDSEEEGCSRSWAASVSSVEV
jgi:hypothetical protein